MKHYFHLITLAVILISNNHAGAQDLNFRDSTYYYRGANDTLVSSGKNLGQFNFSTANRVSDTLFYDGIYFKASDCFGRNLWIRIRHVAEDPNGTSVGINVPSTVGNPCQSGTMIGGWAGFLYDFEIHRDLDLTGNRGYHLGALYPTSITVASLETLSGTCGTSEWLSFSIINSGSTGWSLNSVNFTGSNTNSNPAFSDSLAVYTTGGCFPPNHFSYTFPEGSDSISAINASQSGYTEFKMSAGSVSHFQYGYEYYGLSGGYQGMSMAFGAAPTFNISAEDVTCQNGNDGKIDVIINGGIGPFAYHWDNGLTTGDSINGLSSGTYLLTVTDQNGCGTIADTSVTINEPTGVTVVLDSVHTTNVQCYHGADGSIQIFAAGNAPLAYSWSDGSTTNSIAALTAGIYIVTISDLNSCLVSIDTISEPAAIDTSTTLNMHTITANETGATYQWLNCTGNTVITDSTFVSFTPSVTGDYKVAITKNACSDTSACVHITIIGVEETAAAAVSVYPNPGNGTVKLIFANPVKNAVVTLTNVIGQTVMQQTGVNGSQLMFDISGYENGIYILELNQAGSASRMKLMKN